MWSLESDVNILDIAALTVIVREAGGTFTDLSGGAVGTRHDDRAGDQSGAAHATVLHEQLNSPRRGRNMRRGVLPSSSIGVR